MKVLLILNDTPYGTDRSYNGLRLARTLSGSGSQSLELRLFLMGQAVLCGIARQRPPEGCYKPEEMLQELTGQGVQIGACGTCMDERDIPQERMVEGVRRSSMEELAQWSLWAD